MRKRGYNDSLTLGTLTGGGALGNLIPLSIFLLVYAAVVQQLVIDLFIATIIPGVIAVVMFMTYVGWRALRDPTLVPVRAPRHTYRECAIAVWQCVPVTLLICAIVGGMYFGIVTPTEAAGFGCVVALLLGACYRELTWKKFQTSLLTSIAVSSVVMLIIIAGQILSFAVVQAGIGREMAQYLAALDLSPLVFFTALFVLYLVLGTFLDGISMMMLTVPVLYPTLKAMGFSDVWFGVILVIQAELAQLSPPIGLNLFAVQSIARDVPLARIAWASLPYALMLCMLSYLLFFFPELALWLVATMKD